MNYEKKMLNNIIEYAIQNTNYYRNNINNYNSLDILEKDDLIKNKFEILSNDYKVIDKFKLLMTGRTSGSTGKITEIYWDMNDWIKSNYTLWRLRYKWYGIKPIDKYVSFSRQIYFGTRIKKPEKIQILGNNIIFSKFYLSEEYIIEYIEKIKEFKPKWMLIQPSILMIIIEVLKKREIKLPESIVYIELNGEYISKSIEQKLKDFLNITIANMYGAYEVNSIAYECPYGNMHIVKDNVYVTSEDDICLVTSLHNYAMPIIKYSLGDKIKLKKTKCKCGYNESCIDIFEGRTTDCLVINNKKYSPYFILFSIEEVNMLLDNLISQFKIVQKCENEILIYLKIDDSYSNWRKTVKNELILNLKKNSPINGLKYKVFIVNTFNNLSGDKYKFFERK